MVGEHVYSLTGSLSLVLKDNKKRADIHATPVTIYSNSSSIYKNNKKNKEKTNGARDMFMPNKNKLSNDNGGTYKLVVEIEQ